MNPTKAITKANANGLASVFGKSIVKNTSEEYKLVKNLTVSLLSRGYGVIHGGYAGGIMEAVADTAFSYLLEHNLPPERNIAVPQLQHDKAGWPRVENATFLDVSEDIFCRLKNILSYSQLVVIAPLGGNGTMLELDIVIHENMLAKHTGQKVLPVLVVQTAQGTNWRKIISTIMMELDNSIVSLNEIDWLHFVKNKEQFNAVIDRIL